MIRWAKNDELFIKELKTGYQWQQFPAMFFELHGLEVLVPELKIRDNIKQAKNWIDSTDLSINGYKLEVKSRNERFSTPENFPYDTILVDTVSGYNGKKEKPLAYIMVSRPTGSMLFLWSNDSSKWYTEKKFDKVRKIKDEFYLAPKEQLFFLDELIAKLKIPEANS